MNIEYFNKPTLPLSELNMNHIIGVEFESGTRGYIDKIVVHGEAHYFISTPICVSMYGLKVNSASIDNLLEVLDDVLKVVVFTASDYEEGDFKKWIKESLEEE